MTTAKHRALDILRDERTANTFAPELGRLLSEGVTFSTYHIEAAIAATHAHAKNIGETNWGVIVLLYDRLMQIAPSPVVSIESSRRRAWTL